MSARPKSTRRPRAPRQSRAMREYEELRVLIAERNQLADLRDAYAAVCRDYIERNECRVTLKELSTRHAVLDWEVDKCNAKIARLWPCL